MLPGGHSEDTSHTPVCSEDTDVGEMQTLPHSRSGPETASLRRYRRLGLQLEQQTQEHQCGSLVTWPGLCLLTSCLNIQADWRLMEEKALC